MPFKFVPKDPVDNKWALIESGNDLARIHYRNQSLPSLQKHMYVTKHPWVKLFKFDFNWPVHQFDTVPSNSYWYWGRDLGWAAMLNHCREFRKYL